jgi:hypothetical protein
MELVQHDLPHAYLFRHGNLRRQQAYGFDLTMEKSFELCAEPPDVCLDVHKRQISFETVRQVEVAAEAHCHGVLSASPRRGPQRCAGIGESAGSTERWHNVRGLAPRIGHSVRNYIRRIFEGLGVSSRFELIFYVFSQRSPAYSVVLGCALLALLIIISFQVI